jgi:DNA-binding CsgD family transcriptional regulator
MEALCEEFRAAGVILRHYDFLAQTCQDLHQCSHLCKANGSFLKSRQLDAAGWREANRSFQEGTVVLGTKLEQAENHRQGTNGEFPGSHILHGVLSRKRWQAQTVSIERPHTLPGFGRDATHLLEQILTHLYRAIKLGECIQAGLNERSDFLAVLQGVPFACFLVNAQSYVHFVNKAGSAMLSGSELRIVASRLSARGSKNSRLIWRSVSAAAADVAMIAGEPLTLPLDTEDAPLILNLFPVRGNASQISSAHEAKVAIVAKDPMGPTISSLRSLSEIYHLTPAESRLVGLLAKRAGVFDAAGKIGISRNTARTHMRHLYAKLNVHCQADLIRLLSRCGII